MKERGVSRVLASCLAVCMFTLPLAAQATFKRGDANQDGLVDSQDSLAVLWSMTRFVRGDVNNDGSVNAVDSVVLEFSLPQFRRGDVNQDEVVNQSDVVSLQSYLFQGGPAPACLDAADADDNGVLNQTDSIRILGWLYLGGPQPETPGPLSCGFDPTLDSLSCLSSTCGSSIIDCGDAGDLDDNGTVNVNDYYYLSNYLFQAGPSPMAPFPSCGVDPTSDSLSCLCNSTCGVSGLTCMDAADANDDGVVNCLDAVFISDWLYNGGSAPPNPGPSVCDYDPTQDQLNCLSPCI